MDIFKEVYLEDCPICGDAGLLEEENGWCWYVMCMRCGSHTAEVEYTSEADRFDAARQAGALWNYGKVVPANPNE